MSDKNEIHSQDIHNFIDAHLRELRWASYGLGAVATLILFRKLKVSKKFGAIDEIPSYFITKNYTLQGHVKNVTDSGALQIEHTPILEIKWISRIFSRSRGAMNPYGLLNVEPAGLDLNPEGAKWLKTFAEGKHAWFQLMFNDKQTLYCDVRIKKVAATLNKRYCLLGARTFFLTVTVLLIARYSFTPEWSGKYGYLGRISISEELLKRGICKIHNFESPPHGKYFDKYLLRLIALEHRAAQKGHGMWKEKVSWLQRSKLMFAWWQTKWKNLFKRNKE